MASLVESGDDNKASIGELSAPEGWKKLIVLKKSGSAGRSLVVYVSPEGEEIKNKTQLDRYKKSHPGCPPSSEFVWHTVETPRRSRRLSEKSKETESPESEPTNKREKLISDNNEDAEAVNDVDAAGEETESVKDIEMKEAQTASDKPKDQGVDGIIDGKEELTDKYLAGEESMSDKKEEAVEEKQSKIENDKAGSKMVTDAAVWDGKVEDEAPSKVDEELEKEPEGALESHNEKAKEKMVSGVAHDEKVEDEAPYKAEEEAMDDQKEEAKEALRVPSEMEIEKAAEKVMGSCVANDGEVEGEVPSQGDDVLKEEAKVDSEGPSKADGELKGDDLDSIVKEVVPAQSLPADSHPTALQETTGTKPKSSEISC